MLIVGLGTSREKIRNLANVLDSLMFRGYDGKAAVEHRGSYLGEEECGLSGCSRLLLSRLGERCRKDGCDAKATRQATKITISCESAMAGDHDTMWNPIGGRTPDVVHQESRLKMIDVA